MSASFASALQAARDAAGSQHYPQGALYVVATPIGNLADISLRALHVLQLVDAMACEDTRHTQALLRAYGIDKPPLRSCSPCTSTTRPRPRRRVIAAAAAAASAWPMSATPARPAVSDPGARLVAAVRAAGLRVVPLPGASSVTTALSVAGLVDGGDAGFRVRRLPADQGRRARRGRAGAGSRDRAPSCCWRRRTASRRWRARWPRWATRRVTVGRELTKQFEEIATVAGAATCRPGWRPARQRTRGEFALVLHPAPADAASADDGTRVLQLLLAELPLKTAVKLAAEITGAPRNELYEAALALKKA